VLSEPRNATVQVVLADNSRETREIVVGAMDRVNAEVISGLEPGERVVAGVIQARVEVDDEDSSRSNNNNSNWGRMSGGGGFRPF
jgi:macrolide-specific efflux system membrane fusion protein